MVSETQEKYSEMSAIKPGTAPATLIAPPGSPYPVIHAMAYGPEGIEEMEVENVQEAKDRLSHYPVLWIHVAGLGDVQRISEVGQAFGLHPLLLEDILSQGHRPKVESLGDHIFSILQAAPEKLYGQYRQLGLFFNREHVLTFQAGLSDDLDDIRSRLRNKVGRLRRSQGDYLAYSILDSVVDHYFPILDDYSEMLEDIEEEVIEKPDKHTISKIYKVKRGLLQQRRYLWPLREIMNVLLNEDQEFINESTRPFLRDCYDHVIQAVDLTTSYREITASVSDLYLSSISNRLNEIMKVLTIIATIFIPLTFITGLYGMNFNPKISPLNMPLLESYYGYPIVLGAMAVVVITMLIYFRLKKWL